jgi:hypothetical protein
MSMPPSLNVSQPPAPGTPMDTWSTSTDMCYENRKHLLRLADEMSPFFVGPIGAHVFFGPFPTSSLGSLLCSPIQGGNVQVFHSIAL